MHPYKSKRDRRYQLIKNNFTRYYLRRMDYLTSLKNTNNISEDQLRERRRVSVLINSSVGKMSVSRRPKSFLDWSGNLFAKLYSPTSRLYKDHLTVLRDLS